MKMWNSSRQCKICYKILDGKVQTVEWPAAEREQAEKDRLKLLNVCSEYLYNEICDWKSIICKDSLPFCFDCFQVVSQIEIFDEKCKEAKKEILVSAEQFALKVLRLRNRRDVQLFQSTIGGGVTIKIETDASTCKICHGTYEKPICSNAILNLAKVENAIRTCKKYLFSEIFDSGSLDMQAIARDNLLPFCFDCCIIIHDLHEKSDFIDVTSAEIDRLVKTFALKVLSCRRNRKVIEKPGEHVVDVSLSVPALLCNEQTANVSVVEKTMQDDDCMIIEVIPAGAERNFLNSLCNKLKVKKEVITPPPTKTFEAYQKFQDKQPAPDIMSSFNKGAGGYQQCLTQGTPLCASGLSFPEVASKLLISLVPNSQEEHVDKEKNALSMANNSKTRESNFLENIPGPSHRSLEVLDDCNRCRHCGAKPGKHLNRISHMNCGLESSKPTKDFLSAPDELISTSFQAMENSNGFQTSPLCDRTFLESARQTSDLKGNYCVPPNTPTLPGFPCGESVLDGILPRRNFLNRCTMCPQIFFSLRTLRDHLGSHYDIVDPNKRCDICRRVFTRETAAKNHAMSHKTIDTHPIRIGVGERDHNGRSGYVLQR